MHERVDRRVFLTAGAAVATRLTAGRCISGDFIAHSSYRVTGNAVAMGEAAGAAAAIAASTGRLPQEVPWPEIRGAVQPADRTELSKA